MDAARDCLLYDDAMTRVYLADAKQEERSALRLLLLDMKMEVVGEADNWPTTLANAPASQLNMLLVDWDLLPTNQGVKSLMELRQACAHTIVVVLISPLESRQQAAISAGADVFISKSELPERVTEHLRLAASSVNT
jgi:DNA-binding NarL/FixJ family response regulator